MKLGTSTFKRRSLFLWLLSGGLALSLTGATALADDVLFKSNAKADDIVKGFTGGETLGATRSIQINKKRPATELDDKAGGGGNSTASVAGSSGCSSLNTVALNILFAYNSAELSADARSSLDEVAKAMRNPALAKCQFIVEGHTDAHGEINYNQNLSMKRAQTVRQYLAGKGVEAGRLYPDGKGATEPFNRENPFADENRRVQFRPQGG